MNGWCPVHGDQFMDNGCCMKCESEPITASCKNCKFYYKGVCESDEANHVSGNTSETYMSVETTAAEDCESYTE